MRAVSRATGCEDGIDLTEVFDLTLEMIGYIVMLIRCGGYQRCVMFCSEIEHFVKVHSDRLGKPINYLDPQFVRLLERYTFPGNVRELESIIQRAIILARENSITASELPPEVLNSTRVSTVAEDTRERTVSLARSNEELKAAKKEASRQAEAEVELTFLEAALDEAKGNISKAAKNTGMNRSLFQRLVKKHNFQVDKSKYKKN